MEGASHTSCTIEMANLGRRYDVAVIDEIQVSAVTPCGQLLDNCMASEGLTLLAACR